MKTDNKINLTPAVNFNEKTGHFEIFLSEADISGIGKTKQEAIKKFIDMAKDKSTEFFHNLGFYSDFPELMEKYSYFSSISKCKTRGELVELFNLKINY